MDLQDLITGRIQQVEIPESVINKLLHDHGLILTVQVCNGYIALSTDNFQAGFSYHSHDFNKGVITVNFCLNTIKPFYYSFGLQLINKKYPYLGYWKDCNGNKFITCHLNRIPGIDGFIENYKPYTKHIDIESVSCGEGKIIVGLRTKPGGTEGRRTTCLN
ncbi:MAG TPA: hypothetical protein ACFYEF_00380 [Candidatus Wunengus sp. YC63]|uniref:hypothetical protein n=1 Tax=unclassified Candidatus Wunengus TaxID=3367695 RepID=UPI0040295671